MIASTTAETLRPADAVGDAKARRARPRAVTYGVLALLWCVVLGGSILGWAITLATGHPLTAVERMLVVALAAALTAPLAVVEIRKLVRGAWRNTATMLGRADTLMRASLLSLATYALVSGPGRFWALLARGGGAPVLDEVLALVAAIAVGAAVLWRSRGR